MRQLTHQQIHAYALGIASSSSVDSGWHPLRIPQPMVPLYDRTPAFQVRMHCPACVRIRFNSDTTSLSVSLRFGARAREVFQSVLMVDSGPIIAFGPEEYAQTFESQVFTHKNRSLRTFDLWLPHMAQTDILSISVDDDAALAPAPILKTRWLAYGDSITQGMTATLPTETAIARTALALQANVLNLGIGGADLDDDLHQSLPPENYDLITIAYGTNDYAHNIPVEVYAYRAKALVEAWSQKQPGVPIILISPLTWVGQVGANKNGNTLDQFRQALDPIGNAFPNVTVLHGDTLIRHDDKYFVDKVHPNSDGFASYASRLTATIKTALKLG